MKIIANNYTPGECIKIMRQWTELSQKEFGKTIERGRDAIAKIETDTNKISYNKLMEIAKKHNIIITCEKK